MKQMVKAVAFSVLMAIGFAGCSINFFDSFSPTVNLEKDPDTLVQLGNSYFEDGDYTNAYYSYAKVLGLKNEIGSLEKDLSITTAEETNGEAIVGICTAYYMMFFKSELKSLITNEDLLTNIGNSLQDFIFSKVNSLYGLSPFMVNQLSKIVLEPSVDFKLKSDINLKLDFFVFNTLYSVGSMMDMNSNKNIVNDYNDLITIDPLSSNIISNSIANLSSNPAKALKTIKILMAQISNLNSNLDKSIYVMDHLGDGIDGGLPPSLRDSLTNITGQIVGIKDMVNSNLSAMGLSPTNMNLSIGMLVGNLSVIPGMSGTNLNTAEMMSNVSAIIQNDLTNVFAQAGISNGGAGMSDFTNSISEVLGEPVTNSSQVVELLTNTFSDVTNANDVANLQSVLNSYFGW